MSRRRGRGGGGGGGRRLSEAAPAEVLLLVLSYGDVRDVAACACVSREWRRLAATLRARDRRFEALRPLLLVLASPFPLRAVFGARARRAAARLFALDQRGRPEPGEPGAKDLLRRHPALEAFFARRRRLLAEQLRLRDAAMRLARDAAGVLLLHAARRALGRHAVAVPLPLLPPGRRPLGAAARLANAAAVLLPAAVYGAALAALDHAAGGCRPPPAAPAEPPLPAVAVLEGGEEADAAAADADGDDGPGGRALAEALVEAAAIAEPEARAPGRRQRLLKGLARATLGGERRRNALRLARRVMECVSQELQWRFVHPVVASAVSRVGSWAVDWYLLLDGGRRLFKGAVTLARAAADRAWGGEGAGAAIVPPEARAMVLRAAWQAVAAGVLMTAGRRVLVRALLALGDRVVFPLYNVLTLRTFEYAASRVQSAEHSFFRARAGRSDPSQWVPRNSVWSWLVLHQVRSRRNLRWFAFGAVASHLMYRDPLLRAPALARLYLNEVHSFVTGLHLLRLCLDRGLAASCAANVAMHLAVWGTRSALRRWSGASKHGAL